MVEDLDQGHVVGVNHIIGIREGGATPTVLRHRASLAVRHEAIELPLRSGFVLKANRTNLIVDS